MGFQDYDRSYVTISKEELCNLPAADYTGKIIVVEDKATLEAAIKDLRQNDIIGFDTETRPSFRKGQIFNVSLIQLATPDSSYLIRTKELGYPEALINLLEDPEIIKVGLSIHDDFLNLRRITEIEPKGFIDLQTFVKEYKIADNSLSRIFGILFGKRISKGQRLTNWEASELTELQKKYAALDAYACIKIYQYLKEGKFDPLTSKYLTYPSESTEQEEIDTKEENEN